MCKALCILAVLAVPINVACSWDIAVTDGDQIYYSNETRTSSERLRFRDIRALAYDAVNNMLLFVDKNNDNASIFSFYLASKTYQPLVRRRSRESIGGVAYDPVQSILFWTDTVEKSIYWKSLKGNKSSDEYGSLLIKMDDERPRGIAVDSCRGYIYWTNINSKPTIERARFDGSEKKVIINTDIYKPMSIAVDQRTQKLYWADDREGIHYSIESSNLDGSKRESVLKDTGHQPNMIAVSKDFVYWVGLGPDPVWRIPKTGDGIATKITINERLTISNNILAIVANYKISDQVEGSSDCEKVALLAKNQTGVVEIKSIASDKGMYCLHGVKDLEKDQCNCTLGYFGDRCENSLSQNYCFQGDFTLTSDGSPQCSCKIGYTGSRCEVDMCTQFCLNSGVCSVSENNEPRCRCLADFKGPRCEESAIAEAKPVTEAPKEISNCTEKLVNATAVERSQMEGEFVDYNGDGWDPVRDPILMVLGILCGLLCIVCAVLFTKVMHLKKRPRIKKRIIVNKNVTPLTARPDQCEITIENCCNMNICETPCFEPRSTIRPKLFDAKPGKEEKSNLIANMEHSDDF